MFRHDVSDVGLFGGPRVAGPKPSFRPAVEALEERVVLHGMDTMPPTPAPTPKAPTLTDADAFALQIVLVAQKLNDGLTANPTTKNARNTKSVMAGLSKEVLLL